MPGSQGLPLVASRGKARGAFNRDSLKKPGCSGTQDLGCHLFDTLPTLWYNARHYPQLNSQKGKLDVPLLAVAFNAMVITLVLIELLRVQEPVAVGTRLI